MSMDCFLNCDYMRIALRKKCPYLELFLCVFSRIRTEYGEIPYSIWMRENVDQNNSEYGHFSRSVVVKKWQDVIAILLSGQRKQMAHSLDVFKSITYSEYIFTNNS